MSLSFPIDAKLKDGSPVQLVLAEERDVEPLRRLYRVIVDEGDSCPHDRGRRNGVRDHFQLGINKKDRYVESLSSVR
jgi:hypothetical protein